MKIKAFIFIITFVSATSLGASKSLIETLIESNNQTTLQITANLLLLFITEQPKVADRILKEDADNNISKEKTAVLEAIDEAQKSSSENNLLQKLRKHEYFLNELYQSIYVKLDKRYKRVLYGSHKGSELPIRISSIKKVQGPNEGKTAYNFLRAYLFTPLMQRISNTSKA